jgi:hypothetical protein
MRESAAVALLRDEPLPADVAAHHATCAACRAEHERLAVLGPLLAATRDADVPPVEVPDEALLRRLLGELARHRRRRRLLTVAAAAAVVLAVPAGLWVTGRSDGPGTPSPTASTPAEGVLVAAGTGQDTGSRAGARVEVLANGAGRGSVLVVAPWGLASGTRCRITLVDSAGSEQTVRTWVVPDGYTSGWSSRNEVSVAPREITDVRLVDDATGRVIVSVPVELA